ncbi:MAG: dihydroxyacetone kinase subunit DhaL [Sporomusaceae bacterium]|nr:dihydroxyacetone kinase subunit DhaL [Sporomusaceae bacterium]
MSQIVAAIVAVGEVIIANKEYLTDLDSAIGDGDHGLNMARGFSAVIDKFQQAAAPVDIGSTLKQLGMTLISTVGGASGPLYGTACLRAAAASQGKAALDSKDVASMLQAAIQGIKDRGKAQRGEKTMIDALEPAYEAFTAAMEANEALSVALDKAVVAAKAGVEYTKTIIATKGRASYLGERSLGHQDPGATSATLILEALAKFSKGQEG